LTRVCSIFAQILQLIPRLEFESAVRQHNAERHARGFSSWGQFIAMLFCQLGHAKSLREICGGLAASEGKLRHLGLSMKCSFSIRAQGLMTWRRLRGAHGSLQSGTSSLCTSWNTLSSPPNCTMKASKRVTG
jgi:Domain of unknown function (DUF4372)